MKQTFRKFTTLQFLALMPGATLMVWIVTSSASLLPGDWHFTLFDDAMISMSYARTLTETGSWVWYPDAPRVQGFTNPLWTLFMAGVHWVGLEGSGAALAVSAISGALVLAASVLVGRLVFHVASHESPAIWALTATATTPLIFPLTYWATRGMEVGLLAFCAVLTLYSLMKLSYTTGLTQLRISLLLMILSSVIGVGTRADFVIVPIVLTATFLLLNRVNIHRATRTALIASGIAAPLATLAGVSLFQWVYWGSALPNTYYLKMTGFGVITRLERGLLADAKLTPLLVLMIISLVFIWKRSVNSQERNASLLAVLAVASVVTYSTWVGGDAWETFKMANRYVSVILPLAVIPIVLAAARLAPVARSLGVGAWSALGAFTALAGLFVGIETNPPAFNWQIGLACSFSLVTILALTRIGLHFTRGHLQASRIVVALAAGLLVIVSTSVPRIAISAYVGFAPDAVSDAEMSQRGRWIKDMTSQHAVVASLWAGAPVYYAQRQAIDLLGKSDPYIANKEPNRVADPTAWNADFFPGHNKWDIGHSILGPLPDIVLNFLGTAEEETRLTSAGYRWACFPDGYPYLVLATSSRVDFDQVTACIAQS